MSVQERGYMKSEEVSRKLPRLVILPERKSHQAPWVRNAVIFLATLILTLLTLRLLR